MPLLWLTISIARCLRDRLRWASTARLADGHQFKRVNRSIDLSHAVPEFGQDFVNVDHGFLTVYCISALASPSPNLGKNRITKVSVKW